MNLKSILTTAANFSDKATDVIDNNRDKLVSDFEQAVSNPLGADVKSEEPWH
jgi:ABC-type transporter Mla subunit MlaD